MRIARVLLQAAACIVIGNYLAVAGELNRVIHARLAPPCIGLFLANADGSNERPLLPADGMDYNPSFSADGKWITFTSERGGSADIFRVHPDGSGVERLTDSPSYDDQGRLSPDGRTMAFVSTRDGGTANVWLLDLSSHRYRELTSGPGGNFRPSWSRDGKWIAFTSDRDTKVARWDGGWELVQSIAIYIVHPDGSGLRRITELGGFAGSPEWSSDGKSILYYESNPKDVYPGRLSTITGVPESQTGTATSQILSVDLNTGIKKQLTTGGGLKLSPHYVQGEDVGYVVKTKTELGLAFVSGRKVETLPLREPSWSPDGKMMVYQKTIKTQPPFLKPSFSFDPEFEMFLTAGVFPAYSPSGEQVVMSTFYPFGLKIMDTDGGRSRTLFDAQERMAIFPSWSPDGKSVVFGLGPYFQAGWGKSAQIASIQADGSNFRLLTNGETNSGFPSWSPDGKRLVYRVSGSDGRGLRILSIEDGKMTTLTTEYDNFPGWSPQGDRIAFTRSEEGRFEIYTIRPDGSEVRRLTNTDGNDAHSVWSPDGKWLIFSSSRRGWKDEALLNEIGPQPYGELFAMHEDGTGVRQLTDNQWEDATPAWMPSHALKAGGNGQRSSAEVIH